VIDATGTYGNHNWLGPDGLPAAGEPAAQAHIEYGLPDVLGNDRDRYSSRSTLLVGDGDSAATSLVALVELAGQAPDTWITWVTRRACDAGAPRPIVTADDDPLPERKRLAQAANRLAADDANHVTWYGGTMVEAVAWHADLDRFTVRLGGKHAADAEFDRVIANVGYRPNASIFGELQVDLCHVSEAPAGLAKARRNGAPDSAARGAASCGPQSLVTAEPDFYILGAKSFGRDSRFLISIGVRQIRELFAVIGDRADLDLYATMAHLR
jgi:hypothetical protein